MSSVRANWYLSDLVVPSEGDDPMAAIAGLPSSGEVIDLSKTQAELATELTGLVAREERRVAVWDDAACELKWGDNHVLMSPTGSLSCFNCPHYAPPESDHHRRYVCTLGREQQAVVEHMRALGAADSLDGELAVAFGPEIEACAELAEAHLALAMA